VPLVGGGAEGAAEHEEPEGLTGREVGPPAATSSQGAASSSQLVEVAATSRTSRRVRNSLRITSQATPTKMGGSKKTRLSS